jgi:intein/homing endonuclease
MVVNEKNEILPIKDIKIGDYVLSSNGNYNRVLNIFPITKKKMFRIRTKSGKEIISSEDHLFPTYNGNEKTIKSGLKVGDSFISTDVEVTDIINNQ